MCVTNLCAFEPWPLKITALCGVKKKCVCHVKITGKTEMLIPVDSCMKYKLSE